MFQGKQERHIIDVLFVMALLALFAFSGVMLIALGASVYRGNVDAMSSNYALRTSYAYLTEKIRRTDETGTVSAGEFDGLPALLLHEEIDEIPYTTYLYYNNGFLCELLAKSDAELGSSAGQEIMEVRGLDIEEADGIVKLTLMETDGKRRTLLLSTHAAEDEP